MKTKEEIEQLAEKEYPIQLNENHYKPDVYDDLNEDNRNAYVEGYTQCQEDIGKELEALRAAIRKNTWYDIDGNAQVNLYGIDNNLLNKQD